jgi:hypothetical protein
MVNLFKFINIYVFIISFAVGMFMVYTTFDTTRKIYVYPTPENVELLQYRDKTNTCFRFKQKEVACPKDSNAISKMKAQP